MPTTGHTAQTEQRVLNDTKNDTYGTLDVTPFVETTPGSVAGQLSGSVRGAKNVASVEIVDAAGNQITSFGSSTVTANQGTANTAANGWPVKITDGTDTALVSTGGALLVDGSATTQPVSATNLDIRDLTHVSDSVKIGDGTDTATVSSGLNSNNGLHIVPSEAIKRDLMDFHSDNASHRLLASAKRRYPEAGGAGTATGAPTNGGGDFFDLDGYAGFYLAYTDNSPGASGSRIYMCWSRDGINSAYDDADTGGSNFDTMVDFGTLVYKRWIPKKERYVRFQVQQGSTDQAATYPQLCEFQVYAAPWFFTNDVTVVNSQGQAVPVTTPTDTSGAVSGAVVVGGSNSATATPTPITSTTIGANEALHIIGAQTTFTGSPLVTVQKLVTTSTQSSVTAGTTSGTLVASSTSRVGVVAYNNGQYPVYYRLSTTACTTASGGYSGIIWPGCSVQIGTIYKPYSGACTCITPAGTGNSTISLSTI